MTTLESLARTIALARHGTDAMWANYMESAKAVEKMMSGWMPIETVPVDEWVLVYGDEVDAGRPLIGVDRLMSVTEEWWESVSDTRKELQSEVRKYWDVYAVQPTHWMKLPEPPK